jgi:GT2 family glycosyltransferase
VTAPTGVGAVVVTYNSAAVVADCLRSLSDVDRIAVADNSSSDDTIPLARAARPDATIVELDGNRGYAAGVNAGTRALGDVDEVLVLNPDVRLRPGAVGALRETLAAPGTGIAVPRIVDADGVLQPSLRRFPTVARAFGEAVAGGTRAGRFERFGELVVDPSAYERAGVADWATGAAMLISRACRDAVGAWDESFFMYSEETDFAWRAHDAGFTLRYTPGASVVHIGGEAMTSPALYERLTVNRLVLFARRHGRAAALAYRGALLLNESLRAPRADTHRAAAKALVSRRVPA